MDFLSSRPTLLEANDESILAMSNWVSMYQFICKSDLVLNVSSSEFGDLKNKDTWLQMLWKKSANGECGLEFVSRSAFPDVKNLEKAIANTKILNAVFLTTLDDTVCIKQSKRYGVIVLNTSLAKGCKHLFSDNGTEFPSSEAQDWNFLRGLNALYPALNICNSMIIVDNYLFSDNIGNGANEKLEYNLKPMFRELLPEALDEGAIFELSIFTEESKEDGVQLKGFEKQYNYISSLISKIRPKLKYKISIYTKVKDSFHDRSLLTNNIWISSGHGFDIFGKAKGVKKPTSISIAFPFIQSKLLWCDGAYINVIKKANVICNRLVEYNINYWGDKDQSNRIISNYCSSNSDKNTTQHSQQLKSSPLTAGMKIDLSNLPDFSKWGKRRF
jgi:hypothetical protein